MNRRNWLGVAASIGLAPMFLWACATIMHGTSQEVGLTSQPAGATVTIDGQPGGKTPVVARLKRKATHTITISMDGYQPFELTTTRKTSGWVWGNIIFGGLIGLAVDAMSGGLYNVNPDQVQAQLTKTASRGVMQDGTIYVFLVRQPDPTWERIGQLAPAR